MIYSDPVLPPCVTRLFPSPPVSLPSYSPRDQVGNHDNPRISSGAGGLYVPVINMLLLTLPGTATTYYGEEIGMRNINLTDTGSLDPAGRYNTVSFVLSLSLTLLLLKR